MEKPLYRRSFGTKRAWVALLSPTLILTIACGPKPMPPPFAESAAFHARSGSVHGIVEHDLDGDGLDDAVLALRNEHGFASQVFVARAEGGTIDFVPGCSGPVLAGDDLDALRLLPIGGRPVLFMLVLDENPDLLAQAFALVDVTRGCAALHEETVSLPRHEAVVAPAELRGGVQAEADRVVIVDSPSYLHLHGGDGEVLVLTTIRVRELQGREGALVEETREQPVVVPRPVEMSFTPAPGARCGEAPCADGLSVPELSDDDATTVFALRPGEGGLLRLAAAQPFVLLEAQLGCGGADDVGPRLSVEGSALELRDGVAPPGWVRALGRTRDERHPRVLLVLATPTRELTLELTADEPACVREVRAHGFRGELEPAQPTGRLDMAPRSTLRAATSQARQSGT